MKRTTKTIVTISVILMAAGAVIAGIGYLLGGHPGVQISRHGIFSTSTKSKPCELKKTRLDDFSKAKITIDSYADVQIQPSDDDSFYLEYLLDESYGKPEYFVKDDALTVRQLNQGVGFINIGFETNETLRNTCLRLYVPKEKALDYMELYNDTGDVTISDTDFKDSKISVDYGALTLNNTHFDSLDLHLDSGDFITDDTQITILNLKNEYGKNNLKNFKGDFITADLDTSSLTIDALELGSLDCVVEYGDVNLTLPEKLDTYTFDISVEYGDITLPKEAPRGFYKDRDDDEEYYQTDGDGTHMIHVESDTGDVVIYR